MKRLAQIERNFMKDTVPAFKAGDTVKVHVKIKEGDKERIQVFQGTVIGRRGSGTGATFTVRKMSSGIGVERIFPLHSPNISKIQRIRQGKVHQAKLYYLRGLTGKSARIAEKLEEKTITETKTKKAKTRGKGAKAEKPVKEEEAALAAQEAAEVEETAEETVEETTEENNEK
nr:50S ribosomal protein L19 [candidate division Zixibacteria bacterium]